MSPGTARAGPAISWPLALRTTIASWSPSCRTAAEPGRGPDWQLCGRALDPRGPALAGRVRPCAPGQWRYRAAAGRRPAGPVPAPSCRRVQAFHRPWFRPSSAARPVSCSASVQATDSLPAALPGLTREAERRFKTAADDRDGLGMTNAILTLEAAIHARAADTDQDQGTEQALAVLRSLITSLGRTVRASQPDSWSPAPACSRAADHAPGRATPAGSYTDVGMIAPR